jgi:hypothetical protein
MPALQKQYRLVGTDANLQRSGLHVKISTLESATPSVGRRVREFGSQMHKLCCLQAGTKNRHSTTSPFRRTRRLTRIMGTVISR